MDRIKFRWFQAVVVYLAFANPTLFAQTTANDSGSMWTFEDPPLQILEQQYEFKPPKGWMAAVRLGTLTLGAQHADNCISSASFVSPDGLILTSSQPLRNAIARTPNLGTKTIDEGFLAVELGQEIRLRSSHDKWLTCAQLRKISNVTPKYNRGILPTDNENQIKTKRAANEKLILDSAKKVNPNLESRIVSISHGADVRLYQYKVYKDVRLVFSPHLEVARFGGVSAEFSYPRFSFDVAFLRAYENGMPVNSSQHYFKWNSGGAREDELVFLTGCPTKTKRQWTKSQIELERDIHLPIEIERLSNAIKIWKENLKPSWRAWPQFRNTILEMERDLRAAKLRLDVLKDSNFMARKAEMDRAIRQHITATETQSRKSGDLWDRIEILTQQKRAHEIQSRFYKSGGLVGFDLAVSIVQACDPNESKWNRQKAREILKEWQNEVPSDNLFGRLFFVDHIKRARKWLPKDDTFVREVLDGKDGGEYLKAVYADPRFAEGGDDADESSKNLGSIVMNPKSRRELLAAGWKAIKESTDPGIVSARKFVIALRNHERLKEENIAKEKKLRFELSQTVADCFGKNSSPDASNTPRFSAGTVQGLVDGDIVLPYQTTFEGLYQQNLKFSNRPPHCLPKTWLDQKASTKMSTPLCFACTTDFGLGSTGGVVINKDLEVVGIAFDGNHAAIQSEYLLQENSRTIAVHVDGIIECLDKIYDAERIVKELLGK